MSTFSDFVFYSRISFHCEWIHLTTNGEVDCVSLDMERPPPPRQAPNPPHAPRPVKPIPDANTDVPPEAQPLVEGEEETPKSSVKQGAASAFMTFWIVFAYLILNLCVFI